MMNTKSIDALNQPGPSTRPDLSAESYSPGHQQPNSNPDEDVRVSGEAVLAANDSQGGDE